MISLARSNILRSTYKLVLPYRKGYIADYTYRSVERPRISLNVTTLTLNSANLRDFTAKNFRHI